MQMDINKFLLKTSNLKTIQCMEVYIAGLMLISCAIWPSNHYHLADESPAALVSSVNIYEPVAFETAYTTPRDYEEMVNQNTNPRINTISNAMYETTAEEPAQVKH